MGGPPARVKELWDKGDNSSVALDKKIPVHMVYFTAVVDDSGKVETFADVYGLDRKLAVALFGDATGLSAAAARAAQAAKPRGRRYAGQSGRGPQRHHAVDAELLRRLNQED